MINRDNQDDCTAYILKKFPKSGIKIIALQSVNADFKQLMEDYYTTVKNLKAIEGEISADLAKKEEYNILVTELENELVSFLNNRKNVI